MFLNLQPLLYSLIFFAGLEFFTLRPDLLFLIVIFLFFISLYEGMRLGKKFIFSILPAIFCLSSIGLLFLINPVYEKQIFIALSSIVYYFSLFGALRLGEYLGDQTAKGMNMFATSATIFFTYTGAYGIYLNFLVPLYILMLVYLIITLLVSYQYFSIIESDKKRVWTYCFLLSLIMAEVVWTMNFWPFGYLTTGVIALILYYVLWDLTQSFFLNLLSQKRVLANMIFFSALVIVVLLSAKWIPVI